jgi:hypothetical protein
LASAPFVRFCKNYFIKTGGSELTVFLIKVSAFAEEAFEQKKEPAASFLDVLFLLVLTVVVWMMDFLASYTLFASLNQRKSFGDISFFWSIRSIRSFFDVPGSLISQLDLTIVDQMLRLHVICASLIMAATVFFAVRAYQKRSLE